MRASSEKYIQLTVDVYVHTYVPLGSVWTANCIASYGFAFVAVILFREMNAKVGYKRAGVLRECNVLFSRE